MSDKLEIESYLPRITQIFAKHKVVLAYLFGSQATGQAGPLSDVDIAVLLKSDVARDQWLEIQLDLASELATLFQRDDVDVVILNQATPLLADRVVRFGQRLYEPDPLIRVRFEVETFHRYVDTAPLRRAQRQRMLEWVQERRAVQHTNTFTW
jgi:predicted nucleotidyltransferase